MKAIDRKLRAWLTAAVVAAALALVAPATAPASIQLGAYTPGAPADARALSGYAAMVGRQPDIVLWYRDFGQPLLYSNEVANLRATGQTPMVTWEPYGQDVGQIAAGAYDSYLRESAQVARDWGAPLLLRFAHEMNGTWYPWAGPNSTPAAYLAAWRHVVSVFRAEGAGNVKWVWSPNVQEGPKYPIAPYFPGDEWVDYVGLDGYNWGSADGWQSLGEVFAPSYAIVSQLSARPVIISETSSSEHGGDKAAWIRRGLIETVPRSFPRVSAVVWFNKAQEDDWRLDSSAAALDAYRSVVACSIYGGPTACAPSVTGGDAGEGATKKASDRRRGSRRGVRRQLRRLGRRYTVAISAARPLRP